MKLNEVMDKVMDKVKRAAGAVRRHWAAVLGTATLCGCMFWVGYEARAATYLMIGSLTTVANTTSNMTAQAVSSVALPRGTFSIVHSALTATNDLTINLQFTADGTTYTTVGSWNSATTSDTTTNAENWTPTLSARTISFRLQAVTTNTVQVGSTANF